MAKRKVKDHPLDIISATLDRNGLVTEFTREEWERNCTEKRGMMGERFEKLFRDVYVLKRYTPEDSEPKEDLDNTNE